MLKKGRMESASELRRKSVLEHNIYQGTPRTYLKNTMFASLLRSFDSLSLQNVGQNRSVSMLARLTPTQDSKNRVKRVGRGPGSGLGKTSGRGQKGQKARGSIPNWFEGGQTPIWKLFPKRGFYRHQKLELNELKLGKIQEFYDKGKLDFLKEGESLTMKHMKECGLVTGSMKDGVVILGDKDIKYNLPFTIESTRATGPAMEKIANAGGKFVSVYYSRGLGFRAHHSPQWFIENKGHVPLRARPIARRDIVFYSNPEKNGYLADSDYVNQITIGGSKSKKVVKKTALDLEVEAAVNNNDSGVAASKSFANNRIISFAALKL